MKRVFFFLLTLSLAYGGNTQTVWTLQQCIDTALRNDIAVQQYGLYAQAAEINLRQARANLLPDLNADIVHSTNSGRSIDPFTNTYVNQNINAASYGANSNLVLFNGLSLQNAIRQNATSYESAKLALQQVKDKLVLDVISAYLEVLNNQAQVELAEQRMGNSKKNLERLEVMNNQGAIKPSDLSDLKGAYLDDQVALLDARNLVSTSILALTRLMNRPYDPAMQVERINLDEFMQAYGATASQVIQNSMSQFAMVRGVELRTKSYQYAVKVARGQMFPTLSLGAGINTNYSSIAKNNAGKIPYSSQLKNNRFTSVGVGLSIPIFNGFFARNRVKLAEIQYRDASLFEQNAKRQLEKEINEAYLRMSNAYDKFQLLQEQVSAYSESFRAAEIRFNAGVGNSVDYLAAKQRLDLARISLVNAQYSFVFRKRVLDYYNGKTP